MRAGAQPWVTVRNGKGGRFRVVPDHSELVDAFRPVSHRSPSDKIFTGRGDQAIVPEDRGPVDCRRPLREPASKGLASHSRPTVTLNLPGAGAGPWVTSTRLQST